MLKPFTFFDYLSKLNRKYTEERFVEIVLIMTAVTLLIFMRRTPMLSEVLLLMIPAALIFREVITSKYYWSILAILVLAGFTSILHSADNHYYLTIYWTLAIALCLWTKNHLVSITFNARILIGLCFFFATLWKVMAPGFLDGTFFYFTFLTDSRFFEFAELFGGVDREMRSHNLLVYEALKNPLNRSVEGELISTPFIAGLSIFLACWTVFIEGWVALAFLAPRSALISKWRDIPLIIFMVTTYPIATVIGFAVLLSVMGFAQCHEENKHMRVVYLAIFIAIPLFNLPFLKVLLRVF
jgi:hypothetical protein